MYIRRPWRQFCEAKTKNPGHTHRCMCITNKVWSRTKNSYAYSIWCWEPIKRMAKHIMVVFFKLALTAKSCLWSSKLWMVQLWPNLLISRNSPEQFTLWNANNRPHLSFKATVRIVYKVRLTMSCHLSSGFLLFKGWLSVTVDFTIRVSFTSCSTCASSISFSHTEGNIQLTANVSIWYALQPRLYCID